MPRPRLSLSLSSMASFRKFRKVNKQLNLEYKDFKKILQLSGDLISTSILEGNCFNLPNKLGTIGIIGYRLNFKMNPVTSKHTVPIDWHKTRQIRKLVYHTNPSTERYYHIKWTRIFTSTMSTPYYRFIPYRMGFMRKVKDYVNKVKYYEV